MFAYVSKNMYLCAKLRTLTICFVMKRALLPKHERLLQEMGENFRLARLRRNLSSEQVAERAGIARNTLIKIENGDDGVAIGYYLRVLIVLGMEEDLRKVAQDDVLGRKLQDAGLTISKRASKVK